MKPLWFQLHFNITFFGEDKKYRIHVNPSVQQSITIAFNSVCSRDIHAGPDLYPAPILYLPLQAE